ncbi:MAG: 30S ribosomal protein S6 [Chloroflexi bacterium]|nr:30S ribosomal protein S6 [Chloroflexota bacterium]MCI0580037.1 30S ribosomal protein S6 [Chloroflexota bacterium]MCI0646768.1 30S ribosomal protein S6 [Chloroflexota bacterium]MCI0730204.1 30S ribosomal protein S6 [Chloroflexota bacterium]
MREYEVTVVFKSGLEDDARKQLIERVTGWLTHGNDEADKPVVNHWGQRTLAYPIKKFTEGYYVFYEAKLDPARINDVERNMLYVDDILRHLVVRKES